MRAIRVSVISILLTLSIIVADVGCAHRKVVVTNTPAGVSATSVQQYLAAAGLFKIVGDYTNQMTQAAIKLHSEFPDEQTYQTTLQHLGQAAQAGVQGGQYLSTVPNNWNQPVQAQVTNYVNLISTQVNMAMQDGFAHVKDPNTVSSVKALFATLQASLNTALAVTAPAGGN